MSGLLLETPVHLIFCILRQIIFPMRRERERRYKFKSNNIFRIWSFGHTTESIDICHFIIFKTTICNSYFQNSPSNKILFIYRYSSYPPQNKNSHIYTRRFIKSKGNILTFLKLNVRIKKSTTLLTFHYQKEMHFNDQGDQTKSHTQQQQ